MKKTLSKLVAYALSLVIIFSGVITVSMPVSAMSGRDLYGSDSADNIDIIKLLDMALNKGGMSMSPATIRAFLEFWWQSVMSDLNTCIGNASDSITTTQAFADYLYAALNDAEHYDNLGEMMKRYVQYCLTMDYKSLSDFKQLLLQEGTFRKFLLSYVTDENGNIAGTVNNKLAKYKLKSGLIGMVRKAADTYIEENEGYYLAPTYTYLDLTPSLFNTKNNYDLTISVLKKMNDSSLIGVNFNNDVNFLLSFDHFSLVSSNFRPVNSMFQLYFYDKNWEIQKRCHIFYTSSPDILSEFPDTSSRPYYNFNYGYLNSYPFLPSSNLQYRMCLFTNDGRTIKIWKSLSALKNYTVGKSDIYYTNGYGDFDESEDNTITFTGAYYSNSSYSHTTIQNNIDNSQEINETVINNIVNNYITNNYYGTDSNGNGDGTGGDGSGNWFTDLILGIPRLLAALIEGITDLISAGGELLEKLVSLFTRLFVPSEGFADPLIIKVNEKFTFRDDSEKNLMLVIDALPDMGRTVPTITFPFSKTSLAKYGVEDLTISFDWYLPYKAWVDTILSAILWVFFAVHQYFAIKNIINASGSAVDIATRL